MSSKFRRRARAFHEAIHRVLLQEWDPIGVGTIPQAQDEYDAYVSTVYNLLVTQRSQHEVFDYLWWLETEHMGLTGDRQATEKFAERLMRIPDEVDEALGPMSRPTPPSTGEGSH